jgi:hypothetical protein
MVFSILARAPEQTLREEMARAERRAAELSAPAFGS